MRLEIVFLFTPGPTQAPVEKNSRMLSQDMALLMMHPIHDCESQYCVLTTFFML
jgi:hypothetical protein